MLAAPLAALLALTCARAELYTAGEESSKIYHRRRSIEPASGNRDGGAEVLGCMYSGRWFSPGAAVATRDACLRCRCARGALSCARAACASPPDPPPRRCALLHRRGACCPELHCPDGMRSLELEAAGRIEDAAWDVATPASPAHACAEAGGVFAGGSALASRAACEQCFCLRGARRCVRPRCLPPPPGCAPRPAAGACCPARYYCDPPPPLPARNTTTTTSAPRATPAPRAHDCLVNGSWVREGEQTPSAESCAQCFCLRGTVRCQPLACAPALRGCQPLLRPGHCCPHQYHCPHHHTTDHFGPFVSMIEAISDNSLVSTRNDERSFHKSTSIKSELSTNAALTSVPTTPAHAQDASPPPATTKVKRKTSDPPPLTTSKKTTPKEMKTTAKDIKTTPDETKTIPKDVKNMTKESKTTPTAATSSTTEGKVKELITTTTDNMVPSTETTTAAPPAETTTEQPDGTMRIIINGTINCTAELSSTLTNITMANETSSFEKEAQSRTPESNTSAEVKVTSPQPPEIITERDAGGGEVEGDSFIVNVTSSLNANSSRPLAVPPAPTNITFKPNISKKTKEDYADYDYMEPTLPPSLPNLKIIPFVAADAVVDEDAHEPAKEEILSYPMMEREDKFPVYYPTLEKVQFATRREDVHAPTQYPVYVSGQTAAAPPAPPAPPAPRTNRPPTNPPALRSTREQTVTTPEVNLFSPPAETEGGFIPKGPGIIDEYYAVYPSTSPPVPHLTTSMQINPDSPDKVECMTHDGRRVPTGESVWLACSVCACAWGELHCAPRRCPPPPPSCRRRPATASSADLCCGEIVCDKDNTTTSSPTLPTRRTEITLNVSKIPVEIESHLIPFDPPADRREPEPNNPTTAQAPVAFDQRNDTDRGNMSLPTNITINTSTSLPIGEIREGPTTAMLELASSSEVTSSSPLITTTSPTPEHKYTNASSQEYEDDDDDEGFSFGSVLKLLLSDNYDTTTAAPKKKLITTTSAIPVTTSTRLPPSNSRRPPPKPAAPTFVPVQPHAYIPPKKVSPLNTVNRIDHLVLGEATAIKKTTARPAAVSTPFRPMPVSSPVRRYTQRTTTRKPIVTIKTSTARVTEDAFEYSQPSEVTSSPPAVTSAPGGVGAGAGAGLLKLAGCNIYGRMYRVGRIIAELSTPCQECRCTELGVQCLPLRC